MSAPIAWVVEPKRKADGTITPPYLTLKKDVADKRVKAGDHVTPYISKLEDEDEL